MAVLADLTEEEKLLECNKCHLRPRLSGKGATWCRPCKSEWQRAYRAGRRLQKRVPPPKRRGDCLIHQGYVNKETGYGQQTVAGKVITAHKAAWEKVNGPVPDDMTLDHICEIKTCVNVGHLEVCTRGDNVRRYYERRAA